MLKITDEATLVSEAMYIHCPQCKSAATIPIVYGKPTPETVEAGKHGLIHMAGCVIEDARINRHCKACNCDFVSDDYDIFDTPLNQVIPIHEMNRMLDELELELKAVYQNVERECMRLGRETCETGNFELINLMRTYQQAWALFLDQLQSRGNPTIVLDDNGNIMAQYSNNLARLYLIKNNYEIYEQLADLAVACHGLGRASRGDTKGIDELQNASINLQNARQKISKKWKEIRKLATTYLD